MPEYTIAATAAAALVVMIDHRVWRTGLLSRRSYQAAMAICAFFMILVNGWLTKLSAPIVIYDADAKTPWRFPFDIPIEDYLFGFALLHWVLARWVRLTGEQYRSHQE